MHLNNTLGLIKGASAAALLLLASISSATDYTYDGDISLCTGTCDSFAALELGANANGTLDISVDPSSSFAAADINSFGFLITSSAALVPFDGTNPATANPLPIDSNVAIIRDTGGGLTTGGTTDADGNLVAGTILFEFTVAPFSSNGAWVIFDIATGEVQVCLFFATSGCIPGATEAVIVSGGFSQTPVYNYAGDITLCTGTCDSFAALELGSEVDGSLVINVGTDDSFVAGDILSFGFEILSSAALVPFDGTNPATANPLPIDSNVAAIRATGGGLTTGGTTDSGGNLVAGTILFEFTVAPFSSNGAWVIFDIATGEVQVCLFFATSGCIPGATEAVVVSGAFSLAGGGMDSDGDGVDDSVDNCTIAANPSQLDTDGDGHGNRCDADFNNDCNTSVIDLGIFRTLFFGANNQADLNGDGTTSVIDLGIFRTLFFTTPGPSAGGICTPM